MADLEDLSGQAPLHAVDVEALVRMWHFTKPPAGTPPGAGVSYDIRLVQEQVGPDCDAISVFFRTALLKVLFQQGLLDGWREGDGLRREAFDVAATFPMDGGVESIDVTAFVEEIRARTADTSSG